MAGQFRERVETYVLGVIEERQQDRFARILRWHLKQMSYVFRVLVQLRLWLYRHRLLRHHTLGCQVISIGNLTVGGTGKTPIVEIFARALQQSGRKVAILSRGYKRVEPPLLDRLQRRARGGAEPLVVSDGVRLRLNSEVSGDEPYMLASNLTAVAVLVCKNRITAGQYAIRKLGCDTLVLDDGFQYLPLRHQIDIVLVDSTNPFGNRHMLPRGLLREPVKNLRRATYVFLTKVRDGSGAALKEEIRQLNPRAEIIECRHRPRYLEDVYTEARVPLEWLRGRTVATLAGIASPQGFEETLRELGATVAHCERFADHHRYSQQELINAINAGLLAQADAVITTEKDAVRLPKIDRRDIPVYFLRVEIELLSGQEDFEACIKRICFRD